MRVAMWAQRLALVPHEDDVPLFEDVRLDVLYDADHGYMLFAPSPGGTTMHYLKHRSGTAVHAYEFTLGMVDADLLRFALHDVELFVDDGGNMAWDMPALYDLPWPAHIRGASYDYHVSVAEHELALRVGLVCYNPELLQQVVKGVPDWVRCAVRAERWSEIIMGVR
jgi:hypothetical protein